MKKKYKFFLIVLIFCLGIGIFYLISLKKNSILLKSVAEKAPKLAMIAPTLPVPKIAAAEIVFVPRVIDGDTIVVEPVDATTGKPGKPETVRYVGMDTPETVSPVKPVECYGHEASVRNKALVDGKYVAIVKDVSEHDKYGRLLRFVYPLNSIAPFSIASTSIDLELVAEGYARVLTIPPDTEYEAQFKAASVAAKAAKLGFWGACSSYPFG